MICACCQPGSVSGLALQCPPRFAARRALRAWCARSMSGYCKEHRVLLDFFPLRHATCSRIGSLRPTESDPSGLTSAPRSRDCGVTRPLQVLRRVVFAVGHLHHPCLGIERPVRFSMPGASRARAGVPRRAIRQPSAVWQGGGAARDARGRCRPLRERETR